MGRIAGKGNLSSQERESQNCQRGGKKQLEHKNSEQIFEGKFLEEVESIRELKECVRKLEEHVKQQKCMLQACIQKLPVSKRVLWKAS